MKKLWKYIAGFFTIVIGGVLAFLSGKSAGRKDEKFKGLKTESKKLSKSIKSKEEKSDVFKQTIANKKKALKEIEREKYKKKNISSTEAANFLKKYANKKNKT